MKRLFSASLLLFTAAACTSQAAQSVFINNHSLNLLTIPPIDAITFINYGSVTANTGSLPYEMFDTLNYTNFGSMSENPGWQFDRVPSGSGQRRSSANFFNDNLGTIMAGNLLIIDATNITSRGSLTVQSLGLMGLTGKNIDLSRSLLDVQTISPGGSGAIGNTNRFNPDAAIHDIYWAITNYDTTFGLESASIWNGFVASAQAIPSGIGSANTSISGFQLSTNNLVSDSYVTNLATTSVTLTNSQGSPGATYMIVTNLNKTAVFVTPPSWMHAEARFTPGVSNFENIHVQLSAPIVDPVQNITTTNFLYVMDGLAGTTNRGLLINNVDPGGTMRPASYLVDRLSHNNIFFSTANIIRVSNTFVTNFIPATGIKGLGKPESKFFIDTGNKLRIGPIIDIDLASNTFAINGAFAAYSPLVDNVAVRPPPVNNATITNLPGSIRITTTTLNLDRARLRAEGEIAIVAANLISSSNAVFDCENLSYDIGSSSGSVRVHNLAPANVSRLRGTMRMWSATWTNNIDVVISNTYAAVVTGNSTNWVLTPLTNECSVGYDVMILDATALNNTLPVSVFGLILRANQAAIDDDVTLRESFLCTGKVLTINSSGGLTFAGVMPTDPVTGAPMPGSAISDWFATNAPNLLFLTNNGTLSIPGDAHFGDDRSFPYQVIFNSGFLTANSIGMNTVNFENPGIVFSSQGVMNLSCAEGLLVSNGITYSVGSLNVTANDLMLDNHWLHSSSTLLLQVNNSIDDGGFGANNTIEAGNGIQVPIKPRTGDLMGSTINLSSFTTPPKVVSSLWPGTDFGPTSTGFTNNLAIGRLNLSGTNGTIFSFSGTAAPGKTNGMYVEVLDLSGVGQNLINALSADPNLVIYFAKAVVPAGLIFPGNGPIPTPEQFLDGQLNGHLRWVPTFAGPNSSTNILVNGQPVLVNSALNAAFANAGVPFSTNTFAPINVQVVGSGTIVPSLTGQSFLTNATYTLVAQPLPGAKFTGWSGDIKSSAPVISFTLTSSGMHLTATFTFASGTFNGLFFASNSIALLNSGSINIAPTSTGKFSGNVENCSNRFSFTGQFSTNGTGDIVAGPYSVHLQQGDDQITGTLTNGLANATFVAFRNPFNGTSSKCPFAGKFTLAFPGIGDPLNTNAPLGDGFATVTINASGGVQVSGHVADGSSIAENTTISADGQWPLFVQLHKGSAQILSWQSVTRSGGIGGLFNWLKAPVPGDMLYPAGFMLQTNAIGSKYNAALVPITGYTTGDVLFTGGNLGSFLDNPVKILNNNTVANQGGNKFNMTLNPANGFFSGSVVDPSTGKPVSYKGAFLQLQGRGYGWFLGKTLSGHVAFGQP